MSVAAPTAPPTRIPIPPSVGGLLKHALSALDEGRWGDATELAAAAAVEDIQNQSLVMLASAGGSAILGELYERAFDGAGLSASPIECRHRSGPITVLYVIAGLAPGQAATDRLLNITANHDRARVRPLVLCTEEFTSRRPATRHLHWPPAPTTGHPGLIARLRGAGADPVIIPAEGSYLDGARAAVSAARSLHPDIAVFIASPACPIQAAMAYARVAPVQVNQNIGTPLVIRGIDAVIYRNLSNARADSGVLGARRIRVIELPAAGTDLDGARLAVPVPRSRLGVPDDAVLMVSASNRLPERLLLGPFAEDLSSFLDAHPRAWWMGIGRGDFAGALAPMVRRGVRERVVLPGGVTDIRPLVKTCDIYLNEYPEGGSSSVMESMACGVPVVAAVMGEAHTRSIGAQIAGSAYPSPKGVGEYWALASSWVNDAGARRQASRSARAAAEREFGYAALARRYESCYESLV